MPHMPDDMEMQMNWLPTPENINALPKPVRDYIHALETNCDPAGMVAENTLLKDQLAALTPAIRAALQQPAAPDLAYQSRVNEWMQVCFGAEISADRMERNHRFFEEAAELVQSNGMTQSEAHQLVDYVYGRPVGELLQEVGGVRVTLAALCNASGIDQDAAAETELQRIWTKVEQIRAKQAAKPKHSPLPSTPKPAAPDAAFIGIDLAQEGADETVVVGIRQQLLQYVPRLEEWPEGAEYWCFDGADGLAWFYRTHPYKCGARRDDEMSDNKAPDLIRPPATEAKP